MTTGQDDLSRMSRLSFGVAAAVTGMLGAAAAAACLAVLAPTLGFVARAHPAEGIYVGSVARVGGGHGGTFLHPQFRFRTREGREVTFTSEGGSTDQPFSDGQRVRVLYDPASPHSARRDDFADLWLGPLALGVLTAVLLGMALVFLRVARRASTAGP